MAECTHTQLYNFIKYIKDKGITSLIPSSEASSREWLRVNIYPTIDEKHVGYERAKKSIVDFVIPYFRDKDEVDGHVSSVLFLEGLVQSN